MNESSYERIRGVDADVEPKTPEQILQDNTEALTETMMSIGRFQRVTKDDREEIKSLEEIESRNNDQQTRLQLLRDHLMLEERKIQALEEKFTSLSLERKNLLNS